MRRGIGLLVALVIGAGSSGCSDDTNPVADDGGVEGDVEARDGDARDDGGDFEGADPGADAGADGEVTDTTDVLDGPCTRDDQCADDSWCNGSERCVGGACASGSDPCDDSVDCTVDTCDDEADRCYHTPDNEFCSDGVPCNGAEQCLTGAPGTGCSGGSRPDCRDDTPCTIDTCDNDRGGCVHDPRDLDRDTFVTEDFECGGGDCNDSDPLINPDATEVCDDVRDNDCDGAIDFSDEECRPPNDVCGGAIALVEGERVNSSTRGTRDDYTVPSGCGWGNVDVVFSLTTDATRDVIVTITGTAVTIDADLERTCGSSATSVRCATGSTVTLRKNSLEPGTYYVVVQTNREGDFNIQYTTADPTPIPPNDRCTGAIDIPAGGGSVSGTLMDTSSDYVPTCSGATAYSDVFYRMVLTEPRKVTIRVSGLGSWSTYLALNTACGDRGTELACASGSAASITRNFLDAGTYYITVDSSDALPFTLNVTFEAPIYPPANDRCDGAIDISTGGVFVGTLADTYRDYPPSCSATSLSDVVYTFTTTDLQDVLVSVEPIGTSTSYVAALRTTCDSGTSEVACRAGNPAQFTRRSLAAGTYFIIVSGPAAGAGNRFVLQLTISAPTPVPGNDICSGAVEVSAGGTFAGSTVACSDDYDPTCGGAGYYDIVYSLTLDEPRDVTLALTGSAPTSFLDFRHGPCGGTSTTSLRCASGAAPSLFNRGVAAGTYWILVDTSIEASATLNVTVGPATTACTGAAVITVDYGTGGAGTIFTSSVSGTTVGRPLDFAGTCAGSGSAPDVPYQLVIPARSTFVAEMTSGSYDTSLHIRSVCDDAGTELACDDDGGSGTLSRLPSTGTLTLDTGTYTLIADGFSTSSGTYTLQVTTTKL